MVLIRMHRLDPRAKNVIKLPYPRLEKRMCVDEAILLRRSIRKYRKEPLTLDQISMLLWATYGVSEDRYGFKTCPSAGATYPLEIYVVIGENSVVDKESGSYIPAGSYKYHPYAHVIQLIKEGDLRRALCRACLDQEWVCEAPANIVIAAVFERTTSIYGSRGSRYVLFEVGHAAQNLYLMAIQLGLGTVAIGAFYDDEVKKVVALDRDEEPLYVLPVGIPITPPSIDIQRIIDLIDRTRKDLGIS